MILNLYAVFSNFQSDRNANNEITVSSEKIFFDTKAGRGSS